MYGLPKNVSVVSVVPVSVKMLLPNFLFISPFRSLRAGLQLFALLMLFPCVILHTMSSDKSLQLLCTLPFGMLCLSAISMMFVNIVLAVCILVGMVV